MFWRKAKAAIARFHPLHQGLIHERTLSATLRPADWDALVASLAQHGALVKRRKWALPPRVAGTLVPLIRVLSEDMAPGGALGISADLRGPDAPGKAGPQRQLPVRRPVRSAVEWYAIDPWLRIRAELRDGSVLELAVVDRVRYRKIHKVNPRGKHKTKTKKKAAQRITASRVLAKGAQVRQPASPPPHWVTVKIRTEGRPVLRSAAKMPDAPADHTQAERILAVATELFRWTPPGTARRSA
jgi:hypothetical protein